jgi:phosphoribosylformylglycinamidine synthase
MKTNRIHSRSRSWRTFKLLSELVEDTGGLIDLDKLPVVTLPFRQKKSSVTSLKKEWDWLLVRRHRHFTKIADRERAPMYQVGDVTGDHRFTFESKKHWC